MKIRKIKILFVLTSVVTFSTAFGQTIFQQPQFPINVSQTIINDPTAPDQFSSGQSAIITYDLGMVNQTLYWSASSFTGLWSVQSPLSQLTNHSNQDGSTAIQTAQDIAAFVLDTFSSPSASNIKTINYAVQWNKVSGARPWMNSVGLNTCMSFNAAVPVSYVASAKNYSGADFTFADANSIYNIIFSVALYDSRGNPSLTGVPQNYINNPQNPQLNSMHVRSSIGMSNSYMSTIIGSSSFQPTSWTEDKSFAFCINGNQIKSMLNDIIQQLPLNSTERIAYEGMHNDLSRIVITYAGVGGESIRDDSNANFGGRMSERISAFRIFMIP